MASTRAGSTGGTASPARLSVSGDPNSSRTSRRRVTVRSSSLVVSGSTPGPRSPVADDDRRPGLGGAIREQVPAFAEQPHVPDKGEGGDRRESDDRGHPSRSALGERDRADETGEPEQRDDPRQVGVAAVLGGRVEQLCSEQPEQRVLEDDRPEHASARPETGSRRTSRTTTRPPGRSRRRRPSSGPTPSAEPNAVPTPSSTNAGTLNAASMVNGSRVAATPFRPKARYQAR